MSIYRNSTRIVGGQAGTQTGTNGVVNSGMAILDEPSTTSATTYQLYLKSEGNSSAVSVNNPSGVVVDEKATITAFEIEG
jgi:filamentous hemagglutinin family protein